MTVKGTWQFIEQLGDTDGSDAYENWQVNFTSNGKSYTYLNYYSFSINLKEYYYSNTTISGMPSSDFRNNYTVCELDDVDYATWKNDALRIVDFGNTPQEVEDTFYSFLTSRAEPIMPQYLDETGVHQFLVRTKTYIDNQVANMQPTLQDKTVVPAKEIITVTADEDYQGLGQVTVETIPNEYILTTDATATATDMILGKTAYVNGKKIAGQIEIYDGSVDGGIIVEE